MSIIRSEQLCHLFWLSCIWQWQCFVIIRLSGSILGNGDLICFEDDKGVPVTVSDNDICLTYKMANLLNIKQGDEIQWRVYGEKEWVSSTVTLLYRSPMGQGISMTRERYEDMAFTFRPTALLTSGSVPETLEMDGIKACKAETI